MPMTDSSHSGTRSRLPVWMVILCVIMGISVTATLVGLPYYRQHCAVRAIAAAGGGVQIQRGGPEWLRRRLGDKPMQVFDWVSSVTLPGTSATDAVLSHLPGLPHISSLHVQGKFIIGHDEEPGKITGVGLEHLKGLLKLKKLTFYHAAIPDAELAHLSGLANLESLALLSTSFTDAGAAYLDSLPNLKQLFLGGTCISDAGLIYLGDLTKLEMLELTNTGITDAGLVHLHGLSNLKELRVQWTEVSSRGIETLQKALPDCRITW